MTTTHKTGYDVPRDKQGNPLPEKPGKEFQESFLYPYEPLPPNGRIKNHAAEHGTASFWEYWSLVRDADVDYSLIPVVGQINRLQTLIALNAPACIIESMRTKLQKLNPKQLVTDWEEDYWAKKHPRMVITLWAVNGYQYKKPRSVALRFHKHKTIHLQCFGCGRRIEMFELCLDTSNIPSRKSIRRDETYCLECCDIEEFR